jgi:signal transduction histidine kinase
MSSSIPRLLSVHAPAALVLIAGLAFAFGASWWVVASETRSVDRRLDIAGQTLVEELHGELDEVEGDLTGLARLVFSAPPVGAADFAEIARSQVPGAEAVALVVRTPDGLRVRHTTDPEWLSSDTDPSSVHGWDVLEGDDTSLGVIQYLPAFGGDHRIMVWDSVGLPGTGTAGGLVVMAVDLDALVATTTVSMASRGPGVSIRELAPDEEITTSETLVHKEYFLVGHRRWQFDITPRPGTAYSVDQSSALLTGSLGLLLAGMASFITETTVRRRRSERQAEISTGLSQDKDRFLLALSHQIRTPLTAVVGFLDLLRSHDDLDASEHEEFLNRAADHADEVAAIVHDILVVTRDDLDLLVITAQPTNPVREALAVASSIPLGDAAIDIHPLLDDAPLALADPVRVRQVVRNLVANAIRHGGASIHISAHRLGEDVVVTVADDGPGLPDAVVERLKASGPQSVFDSEKSDSLGLGLRVAWLLAERMRGRIEYRRSGSLTMFDLILPSADASRPSDVRATQGSRTLVG